VKLLLDENLSSRLVSILAHYWPDSTHVETVGLRGATDDAIWRFARAHDFAIVSKDDDFSSLALVRGAPPKVIWLQIGNAPTSRVADVLRDNVLVLQSFSLDPTEALLTLRAQYAP
jgi:predicted nuclease of predicted toxin-antitoxin system